jgi:hypothetical protein
MHCHKDNLKEKIQAKRTLAGILPAQYRNEDDRWAGRLGVMRRRH